MFAIVPMIFVAMIFQVLKIHSKKIWNITRLVACGIHSGLVACGSDTGLVAGGSTSNTGYIGPKIRQREIVFFNCIVRSMYLWGFLQVSIITKWLIKASGHIETLF